MDMKMKPLFAASTLLISSIAYGQAIPQFSTIEPHQYDTINLGTLGIQLNVPIRSKAGHIPFSYFLTGSSQVTILTGQFFALPTLTGQDSHFGQAGHANPTNSSNPQGTKDPGLYFTDSLGNKNQFTIPLGYAVGGLQTCGPTTGASYALDSSGLYMSATM